MKKSEEQPLITLRAAAMGMKRDVYYSRKKS